MYKKGMSDVVSNSLLILIVVVGVVIIGAFVLNITNTAGDHALIKSCEIGNKDNRAGYEDCIMKAFGESEGRRLLDLEFEGNDFVFNPDPKPIPGVINRDDVDEDLCYARLELTDKITNFVPGDIVYYKPVYNIHLLKITPSLSANNVTPKTVAQWIIKEGPVRSENKVWYKMISHDYAGFYQNYYAWTTENNLVAAEKTSDSLTTKFQVGDKVIVNKNTLMHSISEYESYPTRAWWREGSGSNIESGLKGSVVSSRIGNLVLPWTSVNIPSVMFYYNISFEDGTTGFIFEEDLDAAKISINLTKAERIYGDYLYNTEPSDLFGRDPYSIITYDLSGNQLESYRMFPLSNLSVVYVKNYPTIKSIKVFSVKNNYSIYESILEDLTCKRTCGKYNELIDLSVGDVCCNGLFTQPNGDDSSIKLCNRCGDLTCELNEKYSCSVDCKPSSYPESRYYLSLYESVVLNDNVNVSCKLYQDPHTSSNVLASINSESSGIIINGADFNQERWWWQINMTESVNAANKIGWAMDDCLMKQ